MSLKPDLQALPNALAAGLDIETGVQVTRITPGNVCGVEAQTKQGNRTYTADFVVCAMPGDLAPMLIPTLNDADAEFFGQVKYNSYGSVHYLLDRKMDESMCFYARDAAHGVSLLQKTPLGSRTQIYAQLSPEAVARARSEGSTDQLDQVISKRMSTLCPDVEEHCIERHSQWIERMLPLFQPGYCSALRAFRARQNAAPKQIYFCGDYLYQALVNGAVASGHAASESLARDWS